MTGRRLGITRERRGAAARGSSSRAQRDDHKNPKRPMGDKKEQYCIDCFFKCQKLDISSKFMDEQVVVFNRVNQVSVSVPSEFEENEVREAGRQQSHVLPR